MKHMSDPDFSITPTIALDPDELHFHFIRSSGPGGQNVNKVSSAVQMRFDAANSPSLPEYVRRKAIMLAGKRATKDGVIIITAQTSRAQERNRADAIERLLELLREAAVVPKRRVKTKATRGSKERRIGHKKRRGVIKSGRKVGGWDD
jgi:ribosome-associated protein